MYVEYCSNNSGGDWWLSDDDWKALEKNGWKVAWVSLENAFDEKGNYLRDADGTPKLVPAGTGGGKYSLGIGKPDENGEYRWLGCLAKGAYRVGLSLDRAVSEWERITGECSTAAGCPCCGNPHNFTEYDDAGNYRSSGPHVSYEARWT